MSLYFHTGKQTIKSSINSNNYNLTKYDDIYIAYPGQTVVLPDPSTCIGQTYVIKLGATHNGSADNVTISVANGGNIQGNNTHTLNAPWVFHKFVAGLNSAGDATWMFIV